MPGKIKCYPPAIPSETVSIQEIIASLFPMKGKRILLGISGSIAAYKMPHFVRLLTKAGAEVRVVITPAAKEFVSPLVLETLSKHEVLCALASDSQWANHVMLGRWADLFLIAPASCNTLAKSAAGLCDNLLLATLLSATCPVWLAPAMDEDMWHHPTTQRNMKTLEGFGYRVLDTEYGELASGLFGQGRMLEPEKLVQLLEDFFSAEQALKNYKALVTAGPTYENIDPVRFIGNHSSGKMGVAIAEALAEQGCQVELVLGPSNQSSSHPAIHITRVRSAEEMYQHSVQIFPNCQIAVMSAAVADYTPEQVASEKIKKAGESLNIQLKKTRDILKSLGEIRTEQQVLIGFALETQDEENYARKKLLEKNADMIVMNSLRTEGAGFGTDTNQVVLFERSGARHETGLLSKKEIAALIVKRISELASQKINT